MIVQATGTQVIGTIPHEYTLADLTTPFTFVAQVDLSAMLSGDVVALQIYSKVVSAGSLLSAYYQQFFGAQGVGNVVSISLPVPSPYEWKLTINQTAGSARSFPWTVVSL